jgi:hypothetical protein
VSSPPHATTASEVTSTAKSAEIPLNTAKTLATLA